MSGMIFITGGGLSSLGKGIVASALGTLLRCQGYTMRLRKFDPYLNIDSGTMSPYQHGEVFVTEDGAEVDLDFGSYERFTGVDARRTDSTTAGKVYQDVLDRERRGDYLGQTVQVVPHITDTIAQRMIAGMEEVDLTICEIGGTVGDMEIQPFLEAIRQLRQTLGSEKTAFMHLAWVPRLHTSGEIKTKIAQYSVKELQRCGIQPDFVVCRCEAPLPRGIHEKIASFCNVPQERVIDAPDVQNIYDAPLVYQQAGLDKQVCDYFQFSSRGFVKNHSGDSPSVSMATSQKIDSTEPWGSAITLEDWQRIHDAFRSSHKKITIGIVGKYTEFPDTYRSIIEALAHGGLPHHVSVDVQMIDAEHVQAMDEATLAETFQSLNGVLVPGGFGHRGIEGMIRAITYSRTNNIPFLGICLGMQLAVIEAVRSLPFCQGASSSEFLSKDIPLPHLTSEHIHAFLEAGDKVRQGSTDDHPAIFRDLEAIIKTPHFDHTQEAEEKLEEKIIMDAGNSLFRNNMTGSAQVNTQALTALLGDMEDGANVTANAEDAASSKPFPSSFFSSLSMPALPVVALLQEWMDKDVLKVYQPLLMGGTMRLGAYSCDLTPNTRIGNIYPHSVIYQRHRHRYEVNGLCRPLLERAGLVISGMHKDLIEVIEIPQHPFFIGVQFHPEFKSRPFAPCPLFAAFVQAAGIFQGSRGSPHALESHV